MGTERILPGNTVAGFTRLELVLVVAIILILGAIAIPNFLETGSNPTISRSKTDMRSLATAIEAYFDEYKAYPPMHPLRDFAPKPADLKKAGGWDLMTIEPGNAGRVGLTTPLAYAPSLFADPGSPGARLPFVYYTDGAGWILVSPGRDQRYDIVPANDYDGTNSQPSARLLLKSYDPTNGIRSAGDVWRIKY
jgi:type II secretory pathway pseudopilin PulG